MTRPTATVVMAVLAASAMSGLAATIRVPADYPTIQLAMNAGASGDTVLVSPGTYVENVQFLGKAITLESASGADVTVIDGSGLTNGPDLGTTVILGANWPGSALRGFTVTGGRGSLVYTSLWGGGIVCSTEVPGSGVRAIIEDCIVTNNIADLGGGIAVSHTTYGTIRRCEISHNLCLGVGGHGGGLWFNQTQDRWDVQDCLVAYNASHGYGGGIHIDFAGGWLRPMEIDGCTIVGNAAYFGYPGGGVYCNPHSKLVLTNSIISHSMTGQALYCAGYGSYVAEATLACCDIFGNAGGDWIGCIADQYGVDGNISLDPMYCGDDNPSEPYSLRGGSPCLPENNACGTLIGAFGEGCEPYSPVVPMTWGAVKAIYR